MGTLWPNIYHTTISVTITTKTSVNLVRYTLQNYSSRNTTWVYICPNCFVLTRILCNCDYAYFTFSVLCLWGFASPALAALYCICKYGNLFNPCQKSTIVITICSGATGQQAHGFGFYYVFWVTVSVCFTD